MSHSIFSLVALSYFVSLAQSLPARIPLDLKASEFLVLDSTTGTDRDPNAHYLTVHEEKRELVVTKHVTATVTLGDEVEMLQAWTPQPSTPLRDDEFKDGTIPCSQFPPAELGVVALNNLGLGGWSSLQTAEGQKAEECKDGVYCSYACPPGMSKTQWPFAQPANGVAVGGLLCKAGYLYRSNTAESALCKWDVGGVTVSNTNAEAGIALCRTDYPGSEGMYIPTWIGPQQSDIPVSVVDSASFYKWKGSGTSTQYYVNNYGVSVQEGCVWGSPGSTVGNWAPLVIGSGSTDGITYISLIENPNTPASKANFNVRIAAADDGNSQVIGDCRFENGVLSTPGGCTVSVISGSAQLIFY